MNTGTFKTKTFWVGVAGLATGIGLIVAGNVPEGVEVILLAMAAITGRDYGTKLLDAIKAQTK